MTKWVVTGYERIVVMMEVEAETAEEAVDKAKAGDYGNVDSEPGKRVFRPQWTAEPGTVSAGRGFRS
jgi:hypothetical protein